MKHRIKVMVNDKPYVVEVADLSSSPLTVLVNGRPYTVRLEDPETESEPTFQPPTAAISSSTVKHIKAPMPGTIIDLNVKPGDKVSFSQQICTLEAMKMKNAIRAPHEGVIATIDVVVGQSVAYGEVLMTFA